MAPKTVSDVVALNTLPLESSIPGCHVNWGSGGGTAFTTAGRKRGYSRSCNPLSFWLPILDDLRTFLLAASTDFAEKLQELTRE